jgi:IS66 C-terminal element
VFDCLIETEKMNGLDPEPYPTDVLRRITSHPVNRVPYPDKPAFKERALTSRTSLTGHGTAS